MQTYIVVESIFLCCSIMIWVVGWILSEYTFYESGLFATKVFLKSSCIFTIFYCILRFFEFMFNL